MKLNPEEHKFMIDLLKWDQKKKKYGKIVYNVFLVLACIIIIGVAYITVKNINDLAMIRNISIPGLVVGILLLSLCIVGKKRIKERERFAVFMKRMLSVK